MFASTSQGGLHRALTGKRAVSSHLRIQNRAELRLMARTSGIEHQAFGDFAGNRCVSAWYLTPPSAPKADPRHAEETAN